jgi:hypothetical protein
VLSASLLNADDRCRRLSIFGQRWERNALHPSSILHRAIRHGLESPAEDAGVAASDCAMQLCLDRPIDTEESDLLGLATHIASLADMLAWTVRTDGPWEHPEDVKVGNETWESSAYLNASGTALRQFRTVDRWDESRRIALEHSWQISGECSAYRLPMTLLIAVIGQRREARWHSPWTKGYQHPVSFGLRFRKRDGEEFGPTWDRTWRDKYDGTREEWLGSLTEDGLLPEVLLVHEIPVPAHAERIRELAERKLARVRETRELPDPQLASCDGISPCQFRTECPNWRMPSERGGFLRLPPL